MQYPIPAAEAGSGMTVTFNEYPPKGWMGYCNTPDCSDMNPSGISIGFEYNAETTYFFFYVTSDALDENGDLSVEMDNWRKAYFTWVTWEDE